MTFRITTPKWQLPTINPMMLLFLVLIPAVSCRAIMVNCSEPNQPALLKALNPVFNLSVIRPVTNMTTCTNVSIFFTLYGILGVDEKAQLLKTYLWLTFWWQNEFVQWDPEQCGTSKLSLPRNKFWVPDIVINEFMDENTAPYVPYLYLHNDGKVQDSKPVNVVSSCNLDIYTFPFDIQNCTLTFNSYIHFAMDVRIILGRSVEAITKRSKRVMTTMGEWELLDITAHTNNAKAEQAASAIDALAFHIRVRRRATLYVVNLLIPSCFLITVDLFSFLLPPQSVDRSSFKMTLILGYTVFLLIMNDLLPITGNTIPLINVFFCLCLALMVASLLETILITNMLLNSGSFSPVPRWVKVLVLQTLGCLVRMPTKKREQGDAAPRIPDKVPQGLVVKDKTIMELRSLNRDLQAIRLQVEKQLSGSQSSEEWIQWRPPTVKPSKLLFIFISVLMLASCNAVMLNCSHPDPPALLEALRPVFNLSSIRPVINMSTPTYVQIGFVMVGILGVNEKTQIVTTYILQSLEWRNEFVSWDPQQCGSSWITIPRKLLWVPDVVINEFMERNSAPFVPYTYVFSDGRVVDEQPVRVVSSCRLDIYMFPFDIQNCSLSFNSYLHRMSDIQISQASSVQKIFQYSKKVMATLGEWELVGITSVKLQPPTADGDKYEELRFYVSLRRRATLYVVNLLIPSCFLITVDLFSFMLPPKSVDRSLFKMTLILGYTVFLLIMNDLLPVTGNTIPLLNVFLSLCLALMVASLLETIFVTNLLHGASNFSPLPHWVRLLIIHMLGRLVRLPPKRKNGDTVIQNLAVQEMKVSSIVAEEDEAAMQTRPMAEVEALHELRTLGKELHAIRLQVDQHLESNQSSEEWIQVGLIIDRLLFCLYILFISTSFITIIIIWINN